MSKRSLKPGITVSLRAPPDRNAEEFFFRMLKDSIDITGITGDPRQGVFLSLTGPTEPLMRFCADMAQPQAPQ